MPDAEPCASLGAFGRRRVRSQAARENAHSLDTVTCSEGSVRMECAGDSKQDIRK